MNGEGTFPGYVPRAEEQLIRQEAARVRDEGRSRAVLLYGPSGIGKTQLVRELARGRDTDEAAIWVEPIDLDDPRYWLLSNLERHVVEKLDPSGNHFAQPGFVECYREFSQFCDRPVVITLDMVETVRGMHVWQTLAQWMKTLPGTLFVLSGRPFEEAGGADPIRDRLDDPHQPLGVTTVDLGGFDREAAYAYLDASAVRTALSAQEKTKLVHLTGRHPLWLALTVDYLLTTGIPAEAERDLAAIVRELPDGGAPTPAGVALEEAFRRRLVTPYRETDFWHEAVNRLAVVRKKVDLATWRALMDDRPLPGHEVDTWDQAWEELLRTPWIRARANRRYVTLHDALAEELTRHMLPLHDQDQQWRQSLWRRAVDAYGGLTEAPDQKEKHEIDQLKAARLYFLLLCDFAAGSREFLAHFAAAREQRDLLFENLIALEMRRFLPDTAEPAGKAEDEAVSGYHRWLTTDSPATYVDIALCVADHLTADEQPERAADLLAALPTGAGSACRRSIALGNAVTRIPGRVKEGELHFGAALAEAIAMVDGDRDRHIAEAHRQMGFYLRNNGRWADADDAYKNAHDTLSTRLSRRSPAEDREEMTSIQTDWAYVKGLRGSHREGLGLVDSAIAVRRRMNQHQREGISWRVRGELLRFNMEYDKAWTSYETAERIFEGIRDRPWLGVVYQEQAICLFQARQAGMTVPTDADPAHLIGLALDICRDLNIRVYPSALNRAGRIVGQTDPDRGLAYLKEGIERARRCGDGWFSFANLVEYAELSYRTWSTLGEPAYRDGIAACADGVERALSEYEFPDLHGRWELVQGHLGLRDALESADPNPSDEVRGHYERGFRLVAEGYAASHGAAAIPAEFRHFTELFQRLPADRQEAWENALREAWSTSTPLLGQLEQLY